jgi:hypothetical protein
LTIARDTIVQGNLDVSGNQTVGGTLTIAGDTIFQGNLDVIGNETVRGTLTIARDTIVQGNLDVSGNETVGGTLNVVRDTILQGNLDVNGNEKIGGTLNVVRDTTLQGNLDVSGNINFPNDSIYPLSQQTTAWTGGIIGEIKMWCSTTLPPQYASKYMFCDGSSLSKTTYSTLFNILGYKTMSFPAFFTPDSGFFCSGKVDNASEAAKIVNL